MKSTDIKNWRYKLLYKEMVGLDDFDRILTEAIVQDSCLLCGGNRVLNDGLCLSCGRELTGKDREISDYILEKVRITTEVKLPDLLQFK